MATNFRSRPREVTSTNWRGLASVYTSVEDIDLITGGLAETPRSGALVSGGCSIVHEL